MTFLVAMSTKDLWSRLCDLLIQRMALDTTKEEWEKLTEQTGFALSWPYYLYVLLIDLTVCVLFYII